MRDELDPRAVARHLDALRALYVPETVDAARDRLERERPLTTESFARAVERRLGELRALDELVRHVQRR